MKIGVVGAGYVGLTAGICLAESGNDVIITDVDAGKIEQLGAGTLPIYEPGLRELLETNLRGQRLRFVGELGAVAGEAFIIFVAVGTPQQEDGRPDVSAVRAVVRRIVETMPDRRIIVIKSTVPVGTNERLTEELSALTDVPFDLVSNPEFLKEGCAVDDFLKPDRVIIGTTSAQAASALEELYAPFVRSGKPIIVMHPTSSEMTKYAANAMLSTKISFINEIANLCDAFGGDINEVRRGICTDSRIGYQFLHPGLGFGGSCFPKDLHALIRMCEAAGYPGQLLTAVKAVNDYQKYSLQRKITAHFGRDWGRLKFGIWGASFKPRTDDIRESPALALISDLLAGGAAVSVHDPQALDNLREVYGDRIAYCQQRYQALAGADGVCVVTEWNEYRNPDYDKMLATMRSPVVFDGRNIYDATKMTERGFVYFSIGRK